MIEHRTPQLRDSLRTECSTEIDSVYLSAEGAGDWVDSN
jgi:hypothetical protein